MSSFKIVSDFRLTGDQPQAVEELVEGLRRGYRRQTLLGVTGSGKTFTMANIIERVQKPTLVICHNKTLAAQLSTEFKDFLPDNAVEYFVSYYDYYQPEAYIPHTDTYIEKDADVNEEIDKLRHAATRALFERRDVVIVASVSCIYGLGSPEEYQSFVVSLKKGETRNRNRVVRQLVEMQYQRNDLDFTRGRFRIRVTRWRSSRRTKRSQSASSSGGMRWSGFWRSTRLPASCWLSGTGWTSTRRSTSSPPMTSWWQP